MTGFTGTAFAQNGHAALAALTLSFGFRESTPLVTAPSARFIKIIAPSTGTDGLLQISQIAAYDVTGINIAAGQQCSSSSVYSIDTPCSYALDGTLAVRDVPGVFISAQVNSDWFLATLDRNYQVKRVVFYNRVRVQFVAWLLGSLVSSIDFWCHISIFLCYFVMSSFVLILT
jgi:hypothetical protein